MNHDIEPGLLWSRENWGGGGVISRRLTHLLNGCHHNMLDRLLKCHDLLDLLCVLEKMARRRWRCSQRQININTVLKTKPAPDPLVFLKTRCSLVPCRNKIKKKHAVFLSKCFSVGRVVGFRLMIRPNTKQESWDLKESYELSSQRAALTCFSPFRVIYSSHFTLFLLTTDGAAQDELYQLSQFSDIPHLSYKVHVRQVLIGHLVTKHLLTQTKARRRDWALTKLKYTKRSGKTGKT